MTMVACSDYCFGLPVPGSHAELLVMLGVSGVKVSEQG